MCVFTSKYECKLLKVKKVHEYCINTTSSQVIVSYFNLIWIAQDHFIVTNVNNYLLSDCGGIRSAFSDKFEAKRLLMVIMSDSTLLMSMIQLIHKSPDNITGLPLSPRE